jgi:hypothetical protein
MVTLTVSSLNTSLSGEGKKSGMTFSSPIGSSVYLIFVLINTFSFPPVAGTEYADGTPTIGKADRKDTTANFSEAVKPSFCLTMREIFRDDTLWISKGVLRLGEPHPMLGLIFEILVNVPFETRLAHETMLAG